MADIKCIARFVHSYRVTKYGAAAKCTLIYVHYSRKSTSVAIQYPTLTWYFCKRYDKNKPKAQLPEQNVMFRRFEQLFKQKVTNSA